MEEHGNQEPTDTKADTKTVLIFGAMSRQELEDNHCPRARKTEILMTRDDNARAFRQTMKSLMVRA